MPKGLRLAIETEGTPPDFDGVQLPARALLSPARLHSFRGFESRRAPPRGVSPVDRTPFGATNRRFGLVYPSFFGLSTWPAAPKQHRSERVALAETSRIPWVSHSIRGRLAGRSLRLPGGSASPRIPHGVPVSAGSARRRPRRLLRAQGVSRLPQESGKPLSPQINLRQ